MLIVKLIVVGLLSTSAMVQAILNYSITDKRTTRFKTLRRINIWILAVTVVAVIPVTVIDSMQISQLRAELQKLRSSVSPRVLTDDERTSLIKRLSELKPRQILVTANLGSDEALRFAADFSDVFRSARWNVLGPGQKSYPGITESLCYLHLTKYHPI